MTDLEKFINTIVFMYITTESAQAKIDASGIKFNSLDAERYSSIKTFNKYKDAKIKYKKHKSAYEVICDDLRHETFKKPSSEDIMCFPLDALVIADIYKEQKYKNDIITLARNINANPQSAVSIYNSFQKEESSSIEFLTAKEIMQYYTTEHIKKVEVGRSIVKINGFEKLSYMIGGFNDSRIGLVLGETGLGKTNLGLNLALKARHTMRVAYANMEMSYQDICKRLTVIENKISYDSYHKGNYDSDAAVRKYDDFGDNLLITNGRTLSVDQIISWARSELPQLLIVDYDQKLNLDIKRDLPEWKSLQLAIERLEELSKEVKCYTIVMSQMNRGGEISGSHRSQFPAHTVIEMKEDPEHGALLKAIKNRHGKKKQALKINYSDEHSTIDEIEIIDVKQNKKEVERKYKKAVPSYYEKDNDL